MALKTVVEKLEDVDEAFREHYVETTNPKTKQVYYVLGLEGSIDPLPQVTSLRNENGAYRIKLRDAEANYGKLKAFEGMDAAEVIAKLDRIAELEAANGGKLDDTAINKIVEGRIATKIAPLERQIAALTTERDTFKSTNEQYTAKEKQRMIADSVRAACSKMKVQAEAVDDAIMYAERIMEVDEEGNVSVKDKVGFTPGLDVASWLGDMQPKRPHWWGPSGGSGARGSGGSNFQGGQNPWSNEHWNISKQNEVYRADPKRAEQMATSAGTKLGGGKPVKK